MADWSREWRYCRKCLKTEHKHATEGFCTECYAIILESKKPKKAGYRPCLTCGKTFFSEWEGNHRCEACLRQERNRNFLDRSEHKVHIS